MGSQAPPRARLVDLLALAKPRITLLSVLMAAGGVWLAGGADSALMVSILVGTALAVASANALNMVLEVDCDAQMKRTASRPLPAGRMSRGTAIVFGVVTGGAGLALLAWSVNIVCALLGAASLLVYVAVYTPLKRRSTLALPVGALPGAAPPLMGWAGVTGDVTGAGLVLFAVLFVWQLPHFLAISIYLKEDYARAGFQVVPIVRGDRAAKLQALGYATALVPVSLLLVPLGAAGWIYFGVALAGGIGFWIITLWGLSPDAGHRWARSVFVASLVYLPLVVAGLALDKLAG